MTESSVPLARPCVGEEELDALREPLATGWLTQGPKVKEFEDAFAGRHGAGFAVATTSCTTALHVALQALGIGPGDEVIVPAFTWVASANAVLYCGATPVFVDVDLSTYNADPTALSQVLTERTRAVVAVHLFGLCADMQALRNVVPPDVRIVEDAACAVGATYFGQPAGSLGDVACFSFHPRKIITTGEGGMVTTSDAGLADLARRLRNHGASLAAEDRHTSARPWLLPDIDEVGFNYRMSDLQAAVGLVQLAKLDRFIDERCALAAHYQRELEGLSWLSLPTTPEGYGHSWQSYVAVADTPEIRDHVLQRLHELGIGSRPGTHSVPHLGYYRKTLGDTGGSFSRSADLEARTLALPMHNRLSEQDVDRVVAALQAI